MNHHHFAPGQGGDDFFWIWIYMG